MIASRATWLALGALLLAAPALAQAPDPEFAKMMARRAPAQTSDRPFHGTLGEDPASATQPNAGAPSSGARGTWAMHPPPVLFGAATAYDPVQDRLVAVYGSNGLFQSNVWTLSLIPGSTWQLDTLASSQGPPAFAYAATAYDPAHARLVMFGGLGPSGPSNQVWCLSLGATLTWTAVPVEGAPPSARWNAVSAYDSRRHRLIVYGGETADSVASDTWALELGDTLRWTQLDPVGSVPAGRGEAAGAYDPVGDRLLVYGGLTLDAAQNTHVAVDLWELDFGDTMAWHEIVIKPERYSRRPYGSEGSAAVFDSARTRLYLFGGNRGSDSWALDLSGAPAWSQMPSFPLPREKFSAVYDNARDRFLLYGGLDSGHDECDVDVLTLSGGAQWSSLGTRSRPGGHAYSTTIYDSRHNRMVIFGGDTDGRGNDTWAMSLSSGSWTQLSPAGPGPTNNSAPSGVYDSKHDRFFIFGDEDDRLAQPNKLWALSLADPSSQWQLLQPEGGPPPARDGQSMIYDPVGDRLIVFGGYDFIGHHLVFYNDIWSLPLQGDLRWRQIGTLGPAPSPRAYHVAAYDPETRRMLVMGGFVQEGDFNANLTDEMWSLPLDALPVWQLVQPQGTGPSGRPVPMVYDPNHHRFLIETGGGNFDGSTWALDLEPALRWEWLPTAGGSALGRGGGNFVYDPLSDRLQMFGGRDNVGIRNDLWTLAFSSGTTPPPAWIVSKSVQSGGVHLTWGCGGGPGTSATIYRKHEDGAWSALASAQADASGEISFSDTPPGDHWRETYRIGVAQGGVTTYSLPVDVQVQQTRQPVLVGAYPNPSHAGDFQVRFQLPSPAAARLEMIDVRGRVVWASDVTASTPGIETLRLPAQKRSGVYLMRLLQDGKAATLKAVVLE